MKTLFDNISEQQKADKSLAEIALAKAKKALAEQDNVQVVFPCTATETGYILTCPRQKALRKKWAFQELPRK
jgi:hypothetical protein